MDQLLRQNEQLQSLAEKYEKQILELQETGRQHQNEIDTLLKFNEKLLTIIEKELNGQKLKNSDILSLQPISEKTQIESEMFQSQFTNVGNKLLMKTSLNLNHNPYERMPKHEPFAIVEREQQFSIDVDNDKEQDGENEMKNLIKQFRKKVKTPSGYMLSFSEIEKKYKDETEGLSKIKDESSQACNSLMKRINDYKLSLSQKSSKQKLSNLIKQLQAPDRAKKLLTNYIPLMK